MKFYDCAPTSVFGMGLDDNLSSIGLFQGQTNACAIYSQYHVLKDFGYEGSVEDLIQEATENGWYDPETGTLPHNVGKLLESHGVDCSVFTDANKYNLIDALAQGKKVIVSVDGGELWHKDSEIFEDLFKGERADHALVVCGIDTSDANNPQVILCDSGTEEVVGIYPLEQFQDAWQDGGCTMWVTDNPPPQDMNLACMANFDYELGYIEAIGDILFNDWLLQNESFLNVVEMTQMQVIDFFAENGFVLDNDYFNNSFDTEIMNIDMVG